MKDVRHVITPKVAAWAMWAFEVRDELDAPSIDLLARHDAAAVPPSRLQGALSRLVTRARFDAFVMSENALEWEGVGRFARWRQTSKNATSAAPERVWDRPVGEHTSGTLPSAADAPLVGDHGYGTAVRG